MAKNRIIIVGCSRLGSSIAAKLSIAGEDVVIVDEDEKSFRKLADTFTGFQLVGDGSDVDNLEYAGIRDAKMVIATTDDDNVNLFIAQMADRVFGVGRIFVRLSDADKNILIQDTKIVGVYPFLLSMGVFDELLAEEQK